MFFIWDMDRVIWGTGMISLRWYSLFFAAGLASGYLWVARCFKRGGFNAQQADQLLVYIVGGTIVGARLGHCLFYDPAFYLSHPLEILKIWEGGLASHGGYLGVILAILVFWRQNRKIPLLWILDRVSLAALFAGGFIRIGNFFNSEILGKPATVPWAIVFRQVDTVPRHPAQLYEAIGYVGISLGLYALYQVRDQALAPGRLFGMVLAGGFGFRFVIEFFKEHQTAVETGLMLNMGQWLSLPFIIMGLLMAAGVHMSLGPPKTGGQ